MQHPKQILLVEDEVIIAMHIGMEIKKIGFVVSDHVSTAEEAISSARTKSPDVILMDIRLGGKMDGLTAANLIYSELKIPIIIISGYIQHFSSENESPDFRYLPKPVDFVRLKRVIEELLAA